MVLHLEKRKNRDCGKTCTVRLGVHQTQTIPGIGIGVLASIGIENPKFPSIGIGIEKLILQVLELVLVLTSKNIHSTGFSRYPK